VRDDEGAGETGSAGDGDGDICLLVVAVSMTGRLGRDAEAEEVERDAAESIAEPLDDRGPVEAARGEPVQEEDRRTGPLLAPEDGVPADGLKVSCGLPFSVTQASPRSRRRRASYWQVPPSVAVSPERQQHPGETCG